MSMYNVNGAAWLPAVRSRLLVTRLEGQGKWRLGTGEMEPRPLSTLLLCSSSIDTIDFVSLFYFRSLWKRASLSKPRKAGAWPEHLECPKSKPQVHALLVPVCTESHCGTK